MIDVTNLLTGGGLVGFITGAGYAIKQLVDWRRERAKDEREGISLKTLDTKTVAGITMEALQQERTTNERLQERIDRFEEETTDLRNKLFEQQRLYEDQLFEIRRQHHELEEQSNRQQAEIRDLRAQIRQLRAERGGKAT